MLKFEEETKKDTGYYLLDVSKFIIAGAIIDRVFNDSGNTVEFAFGFAILFFLIGVLMVDRANKRNKRR
jgi:hypothetical protein